MIFRSATVTLTVAVLLFTAVSTAGAVPFRLTDGTVQPKHAVPESIRPQKVYFRFRAPRAVPVSLRIIKLGNGRTVRRIALGILRPDRWHSQVWNGLDKRGRLVAPGKYRVMVGPVGGPLHRISRLRLHGHLFPVDGPHGLRGAVGKFGAPRVDGRIHQGLDITANCGKPLVAVRSGTILKEASDPELKGNYVVLKGRSERRTYLYAHLRKPASVRAGQKVRAGRRIGTVGQTGNAASTPCHLHFEVRARGRLLNPESVIAGWD